MIRWNLEVRRWNDSPAKMQRGNPPVLRWNPYSRKIMGRWNPPVFRWNLIPAKNAAGESHPVLIPAKNAAGESHPVQIPAKNAAGESHPVWDFKIINTEGVGAGRGGECQAEG